MNKCNSTNKYKINQIKLPTHHSPSELKEKVTSRLRIKPEELVSFEILKRSIDARKKPKIFYSYTVIAELVEGKKIHRNLPNVESFEEIKYKLPSTRQFGEIINEQLFAAELYGDNNKPTKSNLELNTSNTPPIIVGTGPAGLFCGYLLAKAGLQPVLLERGADVDQRIADVEEFWDTGILKPDSNVQFGEGGAGTFSDGKLNTMVKDKFGRNRFVLETLVKHGAPKEILYEQKPHVGTDNLITVVKNMRKSIESLGGRIEFNTKLVDIVIANNENATFDNRALFDIVKGTTLKLTTKNPKHPQHDPIFFFTNHLVLAIGHSARDTFEMLYHKNIKMSAKSFAVGLRIEHPQTIIDEAQYGKPRTLENLPAASYKLAENLDNGRGVYSFCMCPGGYVVNASSEEGALTVNGMSYHNRDGENANSAIVVTVSPEDFTSNHPLSGLEFQRSLEKKAFRLGEGKVPIQKLGSFLGDYNISEDDFSIDTIDFMPCVKGQWKYADLTELFPSEIRDSLREGILKMSHKIANFSHPNALLSGVESRTSSPVRIHRDENYLSNIEGIYPCGEGAGYAGGITSAAIDGLKIAEAIIISTVSPN